MAAAAMLPQFMLPVVPMGGEAPIPREALHMSQHRYTGVAIILHWLVAFLMLGNVALGLLAESLPEEHIRQAIDTHKSLGITVLGLALLRILWRIGHRPPAWPEGALTPMESRVSHIVHGLLYLLMLGLPLSGWLHDSAWKAAESHPMTIFGLFEWPRIGWIMALAPDVKEQLHGVFGEAHEALAWGLYLLVGLHIAGALKHQVIDKHPTMQRMSLRK
jgi:cytochrome b561